MSDQDQNDRHMDVAQVIDIKMCVCVGGVNGLFYPKSVHTDVYFDKLAYLFIAMDLVDARASVVLSEVSSKSAAMWICS